MNRIVTWLVSSDVSIFHYVNQQLKCRVLDYLLPKITHLGGATATIGSLVIIITLFGTEIRSRAILALVSLAISHIFVHFIKKAYCRQRPYMRLTNVHLGSNPLKDYSFPSGHTTAAFSIAIMFALFSSLLAFILLPIAFLVGLSRMYLGLHYPTDCIIGALLGTVSSIFVVFSYSFFF
ncbi:phosphatase PAP2 family protein [Evansella sp. AB-rgal1]|uniref:phosphatase PAP2 family protein n=1 Tax=Evansella sp. AB-rgal1 TaxID=3242696 RepID=UPI00359D4ADF